LISICACIYSKYSYSDKRRVYVSDDFVNLRYMAKSRDFHKDNNSRVLGNNDPSRTSLFEFLLQRGVANLLVGKASLTLAFPRRCGRP
jgi:hypothetical protein